MTDLLSLNRTELIEALRSHTSKEELDSLLPSSTASLRAHLAYHLSSDADKDYFPRAYTEALRTQKEWEIRKKTSRLFVGVDLALKDGEMSVYDFIHTYMPRSAKLYPFQERILKELEKGPRSIMFLHRHPGKRTLLSALAERIRRGEITFKK